MPFHVACLHIGGLMMVTCHPSARVVHRQHLQLEMLSPPWRRVQHSWPLTIQ